MILVIALVSGCMGAWWMRPGMMGRGYYVPQYGPQYGPQYQQPQKPLEEKDVRAIYGGILRDSWA